MWVAVGNQMPCQREQANFEDPFAVAVMKGELIVGCFPPNFLQFASVLLRKGGVNSLSLDMRHLSFLNLSAKIFQTKKFFVTWCSIAKIAKIMPCENVLLYSI